MNGTAIDVATTIGAAVLGMGAGAAAVAVTGMSAAGVVGHGAGIGAAAGPVGIAAGAVTGLAVLGVARTTNRVRKDPAVHRTVRKARGRLGHWIAGEATDDAPAGMEAGSA